ncbi:hypothetical protein G6F16_003447 [Rhizopus arrhizus]|uniref:non-specific serine/threonine protein kinase n=1 Tax=Rhizopus oryzae TaxID=64495 RepID=A0A9P6XA35_RHIOR|nr:hypothetical protein G6F24_005700 [Rhizopus arrhizus]KAG0790410.1 hypothetical protein G6F21_005833 [Rhizopus arrhizus]KAG0811914.1 hypothetical protein G6F20_006784 [Rhizopus arrhizus]KAG0832906.1 hypothetical protein G6F18_007012 [Rhizopus arrhizus]KAG0836958.1 hypothetical protein G6F19_003958 [Rhizopus arrhizus]
MPFLTYLVRRTQQQQQQTMNKRSMTLPIIKKKKEIGDYVLGKTIGRGSSGRVKLGVHKQTGERVAIKMISRSRLSASSITSKSVQRELAVLQLLHHPNLVDLRQVLQDTSYVYFVMEYCEGGELFHYLAQKGRLHESEARLLFIQLITALNWCHAHHISHRDLKPENILLDKDKQNIKIADFGMAALQSLDTLLKTSCGSPHYASPEIVRGKRYHGPATDVWSCGVILYAMVTGYLPFDDEHIPKLLKKIKSGKYRSLPDYLSADVKDLIQRMLVVDANQRMNMSEILVHPWLNNQSFLGTELRFLQPNKFKLCPLDDPDLNKSMHASVLEGRIWETLKVLWRDKTEQDLMNSLSTEGANIQKLTCKLLQERSSRLEQQDDSNNKNNCSSVSLPLQRSCTNDLPMTPPFGKDSLDSRDSFSFDTYLPPTPKSTMTFQVENILNILNDGSKAEAANTFIMTKAIETTLKISTAEKSIWNICSKESSWWEKTCDYFKVPEKVISIECLAKHECEVAGKLHQVLEECFRGKLSGRMYSYEKIVWNGMMKTSNSTFEFTCQMNQTYQRMKIDFMLSKGDIYLFTASIKDLVYYLNKYENESDWVTKINGWSNNHLIL